MCLVDLPYNLIRMCLVVAASLCEQFAQTKRQIWRLLVEQNWVLPVALRSVALSPVR